ncbi:hypothetical protein ACIP6Q_37865 [Streptomyces bobili]|uniref:hypothetical protein n=1 Tax=Streptomyces bobili TaxID=67280 RepID=UPI0037F6E6B8
MTRTPATAAELALAAEVSPDRPPPTSSNAGAPNAGWPRQTSGPTPQTSAPRPDIVHRAAWLAALSRPGRGISWIGWTLCAIDATEQTVALLRQALIRTIQLPLRQAGITLAQVPAGRQRHRPSQTGHRKDAGQPATGQHSPGFLERVDEEQPGSWYIQVRLRENNTYQLFAR